MKKTQQIHTFIQAHPLAVVGMTDSNGNPWATAMYVGSDEDLTLYFMTKTNTAKHSYLAKNPDVSVVYVDELSQITVQIQGVARLIKTPAEAENVEKALTSITRNGEDWMTPLAKLNAGSYQLYAVDVTYGRMSSFGGKVMREGADFVEYGKGLEA